MTLQGAEQAVIAAAVAWRTGECGGKMLADKVDALLALRSSGAGGETWKPSSGQRIRHKVTKAEGVADRVYKHEAFISAWGCSCAFEHLEPVPEQAKAEARPRCWCIACGGDMVDGDPLTRIMVLCPKCGNKRCPKAAFHGNKCTRSNELNQVAELEESENG